MKPFIMFTLLFATIAMAADKKPAVRKVSNSHYFVCQLERDFADKKVFKKEVHFPFPTDQGETYELKGSMRWNDYKITFSDSGAVEIKISELREGERVSVVKTHQMSKEPQFDSFKVQVELKKDDVVIPYHISCSPE